MKKVFLVIVSLVITPSMFAQFQPWSSIYSLDGGVSILKGSENNSSLTGYNFNFVYDYISSNTSLSGGVLVGYMRTTDESNSRIVEYQTIPIVFQGKYFPVKESRWLYLQAGVGLHFSEAEYLNPNRYVVANDSGIMLLAGLGSFITLDEKLLINISYNFNWMDSQTYQDGLVHSVKIGLAFL